MRKTSFVIVSIIIVLVIFYSCKWYKYKSSLDEQVKAWYQSEYLEKKFKGKIKSINLLDDNPYKVVIVIDDGGEFDISYGVTCVDYSFNNFVTVGDSVFKEKGSKYIKFCKSTKNCQDIELNFCGKFQ